MERLEEGVIARRAFFAATLGALFAPALSRLRPRRMLQLTYSQKVGNGRWELKEFIVSDSDPIHIPHPSQALSDDPLWIRDAQLVEAAK